MDSQGTGHWWYEARRNLLNHTLLEFYGQNNDLKVLDLASACGDNFPVCSPFGKTYGLDISWESIQYCKKKNIDTIVQGDVHHLPYATSSIDIVVALDVLEHLQNDKMALGEIERVLKNKGIFIFNVPAFMFLFSYHDEAFHHLRRYSSQEMISKLLSANFLIKSVTYWSFFILPAVFFTRKVWALLKKPEEMPLSDFHLKIPSPIEAFLGLLTRFEVFLIKKRIHFPFGVSLFGIAQKSH